MSGRPANDRSQTSQPIPLSTSMPATYRHFNTFWMVKVRPTTQWWWGSLLKQGELWFQPDLQYCADWWQFGCSRDGGHSNCPDHPRWTWIGLSVTGFNNRSIKSWLAMSCLPPFFTLLFTPVNSSTAQRHTRYPISLSLFVACHSLVCLLVTVMLSLYFPLTP